MFAWGSAAPLVDSQRLGDAVTRFSRADFAELSDGLCGMPVTADHDYGVGAVGEVVGGRVNEARSTYDVVFRVDARTAAGRRVAEEITSGRGKLSLSHVDPTVDESRVESHGVYGVTKQINEMAVTTTPRLQGCDIHGYRWAVSL